eukprot:6213867-Pleurochrysis_carterae.AAC.2
MLINCVGGHGVELSQLLQQLKLSTLLCLIFCTPLLRCGAAAIASTPTIGGLLADANFILFVEAHRLDL